MATMPVGHRVSIAEYEQMFNSGQLTENDRVELINGEIVEKLPVGDEHIACVRRLNRLFHKRLADQASIGIQDAILLDDSEPEPDGSLLRYRADEYQSGKARPQDVYLLVEVADSSLDYDRETKLQLHARNGIQEYWICNLVDRQIEIHRGPLSTGTYAESTIYRRGATIAPLAFPGVGVRVEDILWRMVEVE
jgi:Uma2 family endonuclease